MAKEFLSQVDPNYVPVAADVSYVTEALADSPTGVVTWNPMTGVIRGPLTQGAFPIKERRFMVDQPFVSTCTKPSPTNIGCAAYDGCPFGRRRKWLGRWFAIMERRGNREAFACEQIYTSIYPDGRYTNRKAAIVNGWKFVLDRTSIDRTISYFEENPITKARVRRLVRVKDEVKDLGPMYAHLTGKDWEKVAVIDGSLSSIPVATVDEKDQAKWSGYGDSRTEDPQPADHEAGREGRPIRDDRGSDGDRGQREGRPRDARNGKTRIVGNGQRRGKARGKARYGARPKKGRRRVPNPKGYRGEFGGSGEIGDAPD